jgi:oxygen-dependent protoporphyrinogen oxidase
MIKRDKKPSARKALISFVDGLQTLPQKLSEKLGDSLKRNHQIKQLQRSRDAWELQFTDSEPAEHEVVIACLPAHTLSEVLQGEREKSYAEKLKEIPYAPMSIIHLGYKEEQIHHPLDGFGLLVPEVEDYEILGTLFSSSLFPGRAPAGHALLTTFIGGSRYPELAHLETDGLAEKVQLELDQLLGVSGTPAYVGHTYWEKAIPQYEVGYDTFLETMEEAEENFPGLFFAGNIRGGVSVPDCITNGLETAEKAATLLKG